MHQSGKAQKDRRTDRQMGTHSREKQNTNEEVIRH